ncbi:uncharacterized protein LOC100899800 [Galendromus occidentalis]|uniref:Uncharacterized protein LOC100899800 n=1 Tax=Galendromus occidentalis TaxID=34638 RepID=A0AAJ6QWX4_9ACAR|nr:uncharacterized protein LOC100899800 [Galendromus occidentalis]
MDCSFFWRRYNETELSAYTGEELEEIVATLKMKIQEALWEYDELDEENTSLDMQASARLVVIDQLLDLRTERTRDMDHYFRGVQMSVAGVRQKQAKKQSQVKSIKGS